jgi:hypothetical protein
MPSRIKHLLVAKGAEGELGEVKAPDDDLWERPSRGYGVSSGSSGQGKVEAADGGLTSLQEMIAKRDRENLVDARVRVKRRRHLMSTRRTLPSRLTCAFVTGSSRLL